MPGVGVHYWNDARGKPGGVAGLDFGAQIPRNLLVNGGFTVNQRGVAIHGGLGGNSPGFVCDRWWAISNSLQVIQVLPPQFTSNFSGAFLTFGQASAGNTAIVRYAGIESIDSIKLTNQTLTLAVSFNNRVQGVSTLSVKVVMGTGTDQNFTNTGSYATGNSVLATMNIDLSTFGAQLTQTVSFNTPSNLSEISLEFDYACVSPGFVDNLFILGVSLAQGNVAIPYNIYSYSQELALCQRYFQRFNQLGAQFQTFGLGQATSATNVVISTPFFVQMRKTPTITLVGALVSVFNNNGTVAYPVTAITPIGGIISNTGFFHNLTAPTGALVAGNASLVATNNSTTSDIFLDAEL